MKATDTATRLRTSGSQAWLSWLCIAEGNTPIAMEGADALLSRQENALLKAAATGDAGKAWE